MAIPFTNARYEVRSVPPRLATLSPTSLTPPPAPPSPLLSCAVHVCCLLRVGCVEDAGRESDGAGAGQVLTSDSHRVQEGSGLLAGRGERGVFPPLVDLLGVAVRATSKIQRGTEYMSRSFPGVGLCLLSPGSVSFDKSVEKHVLQLLRALKVGGR